MILDFLAGEERVARAPTPAAFERAPFDADRDALPGAAIAMLPVAGIKPDDVVELLSPEAEFVPRASRRREQGTLPRTDHARRLVGHGNGKRAHTTRDVGNRRGKRGVDLIDVRKPEQGGADFVVAERSCGQWLIDRRRIALETELSRRLTPEREV